MGDRRWATDTVEFGLNVALGRNLEHKVIDVTTLEGLKVAERLKAKGWSVDRVTPFKAYLSRRVPKQKSKE